MDELIRVSIPTDDDGFVGRECPSTDCHRHFKIKPGTGLPKVPDCGCPYCGHRGEPSDFMTEQQLEYAKSVAFRQVMQGISKQLKKLERRPNPRDLISIGIKVRTKEVPVAYYTERELELKLVCDACELGYAIYGAFAFCPDCGMHNSLQILNGTLDLSIRLLELAETAGRDDIAQHLVENSLEDAVSSFDGYGRATVQAHASLASAPDRAKGISFQNLERAAELVATLFGIDVRTAVAPERWLQVLVGFQKRNLLAHRMGIVDEQYIRLTSAPGSLLGTRVRITRAEVQQIVSSLRDIGTALSGISPKGRASP